MTEPLRITQNNNSQVYFGNNLFGQSQKTNQPIFENGNFNITKNDLLKIILNADKADDGKINGSVLSNNTGLQSYLDAADNGKKDNSIQNFNSYLKSEGYDPIQNYNVFDLFNPLGGLPTIDSLGSDPFGVGEIRNMVREVIFNPNEYADVSRENYQYTVNPGSISQSGTAGNAVKWALGEIGNNNADGKYSNGRQEMWCADFVTTALKKANGGTSPFGKDISSCQEYVNVGKQKGLFRENGEESRNNLKTGDLIVFNTNRKANGHIGMVTRVDRDSSGRVVAIHTVEGNSSNKVSERTYPVTNSRISGFVAMS